VPTKELSQERPKSARIDGRRDNGGERTRRLRQRRAQLKFFLGDIASISRTRAEVDPENGIQVATLAEYPT